MRATHEGQFNHLTGKSYSFYQKILEGIEIMAFLCLVTIGASILAIIANEAKTITPAHYIVLAITVFTMAFTTSYLKPKMKELEKRSQTLRNYAIIVENLSQEQIDNILIQKADETKKAFEAEERVKNADNPNPQESDIARSMKDDFWRFQNACMATYQDIELLDKIGEYYSTNHHSRQAEA